MLLGEAQWMVVHLLTRFAWTRITDHGKADPLSTAPTVSLGSVPTFLLQCRFEVSLPYAQHKVGTCGAGPTPEIEGEPR